MKTLITLVSAILSAPIVRQENNNLGKCTDNELQYTDMYFHDLPTKFSNPYDISTTLKEDHWEFQEFENLTTANSASIKMLATSNYKTVRYKRLALQVRNTNSSVAEGNFEVTSNKFRFPACGTTWNSTVIGEWYEAVTDFEIRWTPKTVGNYEIYMTLENEDGIWLEELIKEEFYVANGSRLMNFSSLIIALMLAFK